MTKFKNIIIILSLFLVSCGFKPINQKNNNLIHFQKINIIGEQRIAYLIKNNILLISNSSSSNKYDVEIKIDKQKSPKIKDTTGKVTRYNLNFSVNLKLKNNAEDINTERNFIRDVAYEVAATHSDTIKNENNAAKSAIQQISDDMINFIALTMRNK